MTGVPGGDGSQLVDLLLSCKCRLQIDEMELLCIFLWKTLSRCNDHVHGSSSLRDSKFLLWVVGFVEHYRRANLICEKASGYVGIVTNSWRLPDVAAVMALNYIEGWDHKKGK